MYYNLINEKTNGVKGHQWTPPLAAPSDGGFKIASPKQPEKTLPRIIADDLPATTLSESVYDPPKRKNVIQIQLPTSVTKTVNYEIDPRTQLPPNVKGNTFHGIEPEKPVKHGMFIEKNTKVIPLGKSKNTPPNPKPKRVGPPTQNDIRLSNLTAEALEKAKEVEKRAKKLSEGIVVPNNGEMPIKMTFTNKRLQPDLKLPTSK